MDIKLSIINNKLSEFINKHNQSSTDKRGIDIMNMPPGPNPFLSYKPSTNTEANLKSYEFGKSSIKHKMIIIFKKKNL